MPGSDEYDRLLVSEPHLQTGPSSRTSSRNPSRTPSRIGSKRPSFELEDIRRRKSEDVERYPGSGESSRTFHREDLNRVRELGLGNQKSIIEICTVFKAPGDEHDEVDELSTSAPLLQSGQNITSRPEDNEFEEVQVLDESKLGTRGTMMDGIANVSPKTGRYQSVSGTWLMLIMFADGQLNNRGGYCRVSFTP